MLFFTGKLGFEHRHPIIIFPLGLAYTVLYISGKWYIWKALFISLNTKSLIKNIIIVLTVQVILASIVYLISLGTGRIFTQNTFTQSLFKEDLLLITFITVTGVSISFLINFLEKVNFCDCDTFCPLRQF